MIFGMNVMHLLIEFGLLIMIFLQSGDINENRITIGTLIEYIKSKDNVSGMDIVEKALNYKTIKDGFGVSDEDD